ncbi:hypothetical protein KAR91_28830, partial [Candidatus Pacearchaeota archaeon]|nr:hypothetical protein [Candidatus Pacearchaeota archaeon]
MRQNRRSPLGLKIASLMLATFLFLNSASHFASASVPSGTDWFEIHANPFTGLDDTGDGGTGNVVDLNDFYVGQSFDGNIAIQSGGATAANIWIDYDSQILNIISPLVGDYFESWQNQMVENGRIKSTGYNPSLSDSSGLGNFGLLTIQALKPTASNYGTSSPEVLDINIGQIAQTTESNIANSGVDLLDNAEDFQFHVWADTKKPYAKNSNPVNGATDVLVDSIFSFDLLDSLNGASDDSGVGTGVDIDSVAADITFDDGIESISLKDFMIHTCSGIWGSNLCEIVIDPFALTDFEGDARK